jgi:hypothetical protein
MSARGKTGATPAVARASTVTPPYQDRELIERRAADEGHERPAGGEDFAERQFLGDGVQLVIIAGNADHVKPHHLGGAQYEWRIALFEARGVRSAVNIDAEHHDNRHFIGHAGDLPS